MASSRSRKEVMKSAKKRGDYNCPISLKVLCGELNADINMKVNMDDVFKYFSKNYMIPIINVRPLNILGTMIC